MLGEAGIGKTRLVTEARSLALSRGVRVLQSAAFELDPALPYGPIADLLRAFIAGKTADEVSDELGPALVALARLVLLAFDRLVEHGPTMVVIEDIHWADEASLDLVLHLARSAATRPLLLVLTLRPDDASPSVVGWRNTLDRQRPTIELPLLPLEQAAVDAMVHCIVGDTVPSDLLETITELGEGNPFFIEEAFPPKMSLTANW